MCNPLSNMQVLQTIFLVHNFSTVYENPSKSKQALLKYDEIIILAMAQLSGALQPHFLLVWVTPEVFEVLFVFIVNFLTTEWKTTYWPQLSRPGWDTLLHPLWEASVLPVPDPSGASAVPVPVPWRASVLPTQTLKGLHGLWTFVTLRKLSRVHCRQVI